MDEQRGGTPNDTAFQSSAFATVIRSLFHGKEAPYTSADAFRQLYERTHVPVYRFVYALHGGPAEDVEDIAAETFERAWDRRAHFHGDDAVVMGWLLTIARNLVIDRQRKQQRRPIALPIDQVEHEGLTDVVIDDVVVGTNLGFAPTPGVPGLTYARRIISVIPPSGLRLLRVQPDAVAIGHRPYDESILSTPRA